jgi:hypothetical protein
MRWFQRMMAAAILSAAAVAATAGACFGATLATYP